MSAAGVHSDSLRPILLRSSTPAPNEKVLLYLEGMRESEAHTSITSPSIPPLATPFGRRSALTADEDLDEVQTNVQDGRKTEISNDHHSVLHEPGPFDPPGPRYESFDSGPSFGNLGLLPGNASHIGEPPWASSSVTGARVPPSPSVASPPHVITIEPPSITSGSKSHTPRSTSQVSPSRPKSKSDASGIDTIRAPTSAMHAVAPEDRSTSPSRRSRAGSRSRVGAEYPPLPPSTFLSPSGRTAPLPTSPRSHRREPSISPSDSPSQAPFKFLNKAAKHAQSHTTLEVDVERRATSAAGGPVSPTHHARPFSPYRCGATHEDLFAGAAQVQKTATQTQIASQLNGGESKLSHVTHHSHKTERSHQHSHFSHSHRIRVEEEDGVTPTPSRPQSPTFSLDPDEQHIVNQTLLAGGAGNRTSYAPSTLEPEIINSHFHDMDLCVLLHQMDDRGTHEVVKRALRKAVRQRVKKLGMKYDHESIKQYQKSYHDHDPGVHLDADYQPSLVSQVPPPWAQELIIGMSEVQKRLEVLSPQSLGASIPRSMQSYAESSTSRRQHIGEEATEYTEGIDPYGQTPRTQTVNINTQATGTMAESMYRNGTEGTDEYADTEEATQRFAVATATETKGISEFLAGERDDSPGQQFLEEELYKLRIKTGGSQLAKDEYGGHTVFTESCLPEIPDGANYTDNRRSPSLPPLPQDESHANSHVWHLAGDNLQHLMSPWQRIHHRLLSWAIIWPMAELDAALNSTTRGHQVDEVSLSIWSTQTYKRYVRSRITDMPGGKVDRLFVAPNIADAISNAVYHGRHTDACGMLRDLWSPLGFDGSPRLVLVLAKHHDDANHWVVHRFSLPDNSLSTYDTVPERTVPDGRPLGWWFAIRLAWPDGDYVDADRMVQKVVRLHRPMQLTIDNSVAAAGIWRNLVMGSRPERSLDLERLRDLINTEVKNLRQRKLQGKLSINMAKAQYEDV